ncbi:50S ribosomal protein L25/general stress protein Ctc [Kineosporia sp. NBRC 101731]|uniref:50S ribosomal protein L25/general stress protein Ctc n=1 Tax=Kineosporia sp. NBRC 101731 TaxID=3032199 RepID=UPI00249FC9EB|nr:50S ribosomal protein L25/general stress protein Ctc [Kineosporia sp. NBRC 101731]GLY28702.1 50S ribosomal protein L25 [Kineosporia sp. NBRC 101731]
MSEVKLSATPRNDFGKGAARRLRRDHQVPAVLYGHGTDPVHVALPGHATMLALKNANALLTIDIDGKSQLAIPKDVQRHALKGSIEHVDLLIVRQGEKVTVDVALHFTGDPAPGGRAQAELNSLSLEVEATAIPDGIEFSIEGTEVGTQIHAGQIPLPEGATLIGDPDAIVIAVTDSTRAVGTEAEAAEADAVAAEG